MDKLKSYEEEKYRKILFLESQGWWNFDKGISRRSFGAMAEIDYLVVGLWDDIP